jgi:hypothetical protein
VYGLLFPAYESNRVHESNRHNVAGKPDAKTAWGARYKRRAWDGTCDGEKVGNGARREHVNCVAGRGAHVGMKICFRIFVTESSRTFFSFRDAAAEGKRLPATRTHAHTPPCPAAANLLVVMFSMNKQIKAFF